MLIKMILIKADIHTYIIRFTWLPYSTMKNVFVLLCYMTSLKITETVFLLII